MTFSFQKVLSVPLQNMRETQVGGRWYVLARPQHHLEAQKRRPTPDLQSLQPTTTAIDIRG